MEGFEPRRVGALQAYLRQAVLNRMRDELRRHARRPDQIGLEDGRRSSGESPLEQAIGRETVRVLRARAGATEARGAGGDHRARRAGHDLSRRWPRRSASRRPKRRARRRERALVRLAKEMSSGRVRGSTPSSPPPSWTAPRSTGRRPKSSGSEADRPVLESLESSRRHRRPPSQSSAVRRRPASASGVHRPARALGAPAAARAHRRRLLRRGLSRLGRAARSRSRAQAARCRCAARSASSSAAPPSSKRAALLARVRHPNVVTLYGADVIDDRIGLWMELVSGRTLEQVVAERQAIRPRPRLLPSESTSAARSRRCTPPGCSIATSRRRT